MKSSVVLGMFLGMSLIAQETNVPFKPSPIQKSPIGKGVTKICLGTMGLFLFSYCLACIGFQGLKKEWYKSRIKIGDGKGKSDFNGQRAVLYSALLASPALPFYCLYDGLCDVEAFQRSKAYMMRLQQRFAQRKSN